MIEVGQIFSKNGFEYCVLDLIEFDNKIYAFMSVEDDNIEYLFYQIQKYDNDYNFILVDNDELNYNLFNIMEGRI